MLALNKIISGIVILVLFGGSVFAQNKQQKTKPKAKIKKEALPKSVIIKQPDGSQLNVVSVFVKPDTYAETIDGYTIIKNEKGIYEYALVDINCNMITSGIKARNPKERTGLETRYLYSKKLKKHLRKDYFQD